MTSSDWYANQPFNNAAGSTVLSGGAGSLFFRDPLDVKRSMQGRTPEAQYPDGYAGTIINRREDKLLDAVKKRMNDRSYQRGVHKGDQLPKSDYYWPETGSVRPTMGIEREARGHRNDFTVDVERFAPTGHVVERLAHGGKTDFTPPERLQLYDQYQTGGLNTADVTIDPKRAEFMKRMMPSWRS
jgi:hypothetical protein